MSDPLVSSDITWLKTLLFGASGAVVSILGYLNVRITRTSKTLHARIDATNKEIAKVEENTVQRRDMQLYLAPIQAAQATLLAEISLLRPKVHDLSEDVHLAVDKVDTIGEQMGRALALLDRRRDEIDSDHRRNK